MGHDVTTVQREGWAGIENGDLLNLVDGHFDVLVLADKNLRYQQNLSSRRIALVELPTNRRPLLERMAAKIAEAVNKASPGSYIHLESWHSKDPAPINLSYAFVPVASSVSKWGSTVSLETGVTSTFVNFAFFRNWSSALSLKPSHKSA